MADSRKTREANWAFVAFFVSFFFAIEKNEKTNQAKDYGKEAQCP